MRLRTIGSCLCLCAALTVPLEARGKPLVLWHAYRAAERTALEAVVKRWNAGARGKDPAIKLLAVPYDAFPDKISAAIPRGHGPDLFIFAHDRVGDWAEAKVIEPIEFWMTEKHADQFIFKAIDALCYRDSLYGLPMAFKSTALYYNKALVPAPPRTTRELLAVGRRLTDAGAGTFGLVYDNTKLYFHAAWLFGYGGRIFDDKGRLAVDTPAARRALAFAQQLGRKGGIIPPESSPTLTTTLFNQGKAAMAISGPWLLGELSKRVQVGVAPLPRISASGKPASPFVGAEGIMMSARSRRKAAAFRAMSYLTSDSAAIARARSARQPVANHAAWRDPGIKADPVLRAFRKQLDSATVMPGTPQMRLVWSPYDMALQKVLNGRATPAAALGEAAAEIRRFLAAMKQKGRP
jgi:arabinogalactan oligomer/maltooligosaccharide transport system substrate-binding protein